MRLKNLDLILTTAIALINMLWALLPNHPPVIGIILALLLVFLVPGYALTEFLFYKRPFDGVSRFILNIGLSLITDILSGFILNIFPTGLRAMSWTVFLGLLTIVFSLLAMYFRRGSLIGEIQLPKFHFDVHEYILLGMSIIVTILSIEYSTVKTARQLDSGFTQLWMLPSTQTNNNCAIRLGVRSFEGTSVTYRMIMTVNGIQVNTWPVVLVPQENGIN